MSSGLCDLRTVSWSQIRQEGTYFPCKKGVELTIGSEWFSALNLQCHTRQWMSQKLT